jgi:hypothetical protein
VGEYHEWAGWEAGGGGGRPGADAIEEAYFVVRLGKKEILRREMRSSG